MSEKELIAVEELEAKIAPDSSAGFLDAVSFHTHFGNTHHTVIIHHPRPMQSGSDFLD